MRFASPLFPYMFAAGDVDADGDVDFVCNDGGLRLHVNDGTGVLTDVTAAQMPAVMPVSNTILADLDEDGDLDLFATNSAPYGNLLLNDGSGRFMNGTAGRWLPGYSSLTGLASCNAHDVDDDGDLDLLVGTNRFFNAQATQAIVVNHARQTATRSLPRLGGSFEIDTFAAPGFAPPGVSLLLAAFGALPPTRVPGLDGTLQIDTASMVTVRLFVTAPGGVFRQSVAIPPLPMFLGTRVLWQQLLVPQNGVPGFSNAVEETVVY
jgi:hypothetical protein